jgi:hypothetical protein
MISLAWPPSWMLWNFKIFIFFLEFLRTYMPSGLFYDAEILAWLILLYSTHCLQCQQSNIFLVALPSIPCNAETLHIADLAV